MSGCGQPPPSTGAMDSIAFLCSPTLPASAAVVFISSVYLP